MESKIILNSTVHHQFLTIYKQGLTIDKQGLTINKQGDKITFDHSQEK